MKVFILHVRHKTLVVSTFTHKTPAVSTLCDTKHRSSPLCETQSTSRPHFLTKKWRRLVFFSNFMHRIGFHPCFCTNFLCHLQFQGEDEKALNVRLKVKYVRRQPPLGVGPENNLFKLLHLMLPLAVEGQVMGAGTQQQQLRLKNTWQRRALVPLRQRAQARARAKCP